MPELDSGSDSAIVTAVAAQLPEITEEQVSMVLSAWNTVQNGEPVGTIVTDPDTGNVAVRVSESGVHVWRVTAPDGGSWSDTQPTMSGWTVIRAGNE